jgi:hypothetical protein
MREYNRRVNSPWELQSHVLNTTLRVTMRQRIPRRRFNHLRVVKWSSLDIPDEMEHVTISKNQTVKRGNVSDECRVFELMETWR